MDAYVSKPVQAQRLLDVIESLVSRVHKEEKQMTSEPASSSSYDLDTALARVDGDIQLLQEVAELFCEDAPSMLEGIRDSIMRDDAGSLERGAHALKGDVSNFGAKQAWECALQLEMLGRDGEMGQASSAFDQLDQEINGLMDALAAHGPSQSLPPPV